MGGRSLLNTALMLVGALICVQTVVTVLERTARPVSVDPSFYVEVQQAQTAMGGRSFNVSNRSTGPSASIRTP